MKLSSFQASPAFVCACVPFPGMTQGNLSSWQWGMSLIERRIEKQKVSLYCLSADDLGSLHMPKQSALTQGSWPHEVFLRLAAMRSYLELRRNFAFPSTGGSDCLPIYQNSVWAIWTTVLYPKTCHPMGICSDCCSWITFTQRQCGPYNVFRSIWIFLSSLCLFSSPGSCPIKP